MNNAATKTLTDLLNTATSAIARQSTNSRVPCEFRKAAGKALEAAQDLIASAPRLAQRARWVELVKLRWSEIA
jgi:hypothetical protein